MTIFLTALVVWGVSGVIIAAILARHGHNFWLYALMGLGYGPLLIAVWLATGIAHPSHTTMLKEGSPLHDDGWIDVLVGLDGSEASIESVAAVLQMLDPALRRVRLASALDHEIADAPDGFELDDHRIQYLREAALELGLDDPELVLVSGQPDKALVQHALENDLDLLIVAHRRQPVIATIKGSTASRLARSADLPIIIGPPT